MNTRLPGIAFVVVVALSGAVCSGVSTPWVDAVVSFDQPAGSSTGGGPAFACLGAPDGQFVSVDTPEQLILAFTTKRVYDGPGDDLWVYEAGNCGASVDVFGRSADGPCTHLATITNSTGIDLADVGLQYIDFIRFVGIDESGAFPGYDLDAVRALNFIDQTSNGGCVPAPGAAVLCLIGTGLVGWLRRRIL